NGIEADNWSDGNDASPRSKPTIYNYTLIGSGADGSQRGITFKEGTAGQMANGIIMGQPLEGIDIAETATVNQLMTDELQVRHTLFFDIGVGGTHYFPTLAEETEQEPDDERQDDGGFDEEAHFQNPDYNNTFGQDPAIASPYSLTSPSWVPTSTNLPTGITPPPGFIDESSNYLGAFEPGAVPWTEGWTAYPEN
ncbi:MAG: hypothetical protein AAFS10_16440, partial [Myxococcota bacterium]